MNRIFSAVLFFLLPLVVAAADAGRVAQVQAGKIHTAYASWWGFDEKDSSAILQSALDSGVRKLIVDNTGRDWVVGKGLVLPSDLELVIADGVTVRAARGAFRKIGECLITASACRNTTIRGMGSARLVMNRADYEDPAKYRRGEWRHIISLKGVTDFTIRDIRLVGSGGDGIYAGAGLQKVCRNLRIENVVAEDGNRLGIAVISAENFLMRNCRFVRSHGVSVGGGLDLEPNRPGERLVNCVIENCEFSDNRGSGISVSPNNLNENSLPVSITFRNCRSVGNGLGLFLYPFNQTRKRAKSPVRGKVEFIGCEFLGSSSLFQDPVSAGIRFSFRNCVFSNGKTKQPVIKLVCKFSPGYQIGGLHFDESVVRCDSAGTLPLILSCQGRGAVSDEIGGSLRIDCGNQSRPFDFAGFLKERQNYFNRINSLKSPVAVDLKKLNRMTEARERATDGAFLRKQCRFIQYAEKGERIKVTAHLVSSGYPGTADILLKSPGGRMIRKFTFSPDNKDHDMVFVAGEAGYHTFLCNTIHRICLMSSRPGGAYLPEDGMQILLPIAGRLYFEVPEKVKNFTIGVSADQAASVSLLDSQGREIMRRDNIDSMTLLGGSRTDASRSEIWAVEISKAVWLVSLRMYAPLIPLLSSNPDTLPITGDPRKVIRGFIPSEELRK